MTKKRYVRWTLDPDNGQRKDGDGGSAGPDHFPEGECRIEMKTARPALRRTPGAGRP